MNHRRHKPNHAALNLAFLAVAAVLSAAFIAVAWLLGRLRKPAPDDADSRACGASTPPAASKQTSPP